MNRRGWFITGTDTGVGKTWVTTRLLTLLRSTGVDAIGMKAIECGGRDDARALLSASSDSQTPLTLDQINPCSLAAPLAPAAMIPQPEIAFAPIIENYQLLANRHECILVEGAGGWLMPLDRERRIADLAQAIGLPTLIVAANRLGVLNHVLLTVSAIRATGLPCAGVFLNEIDPASAPDDHSRRSNARVLRECLPDLPVIDQNLETLAALLDSA